MSVMERLMMQLEPQQSQRAMMVGTRLLLVVRTHAPHFAELSSAFGCLIWGGILLLPAPTFATAVNYHAMAWLFPEWVWGLYALSLALWQLYALDQDDVKRRKQATFGMAVSWTFITAMFAAGNPFAPGIGPYLLIVLNAGWARWRLTYQYGDE